MAFRLEKVPVNAEPVWLIVQVQLFGCGAQTVVESLAVPAKLPVSVRFAL